jgi:hypothetical protein
VHGDRECRKCTACPAGQFSNGCDGDSNGGCRGYKHCIEDGFGNFRIAEGTTIQDVQCGKCPPSESQRFESYQFHFANKFNYTLALKDQTTGDVHTSPLSEDLQRFIDDLRQHLNDLFLDKDQFCYYNITSITPTDIDLGTNPVDNLIEVGIVLDPRSRQMEVLQEKIDANQLGFFYTRTGVRGTRRIAMRTVPGSFGKQIFQVVLDNFDDLTNEQDLRFAEVREGRQSIQRNLETRLEGGRSMLHLCSKAFFEEFVLAEMEGQVFEEATFTALRGSAPFCYECSVETGACKDNYELGLEAGTARAREGLTELIWGDPATGYLTCRNISEAYRNRVGFGTCPAVPTVPPKRLATTILPYIYVTAPNGKILSDEEAIEQQNRETAVARSANSKEAESGDLLGTGSTAGSIAIIVCISVLILAAFVGVLLVRSRAKKQRRISADRRRSLARKPMSEDNHPNALMWENPLFKEHLSAEHAVEADHLATFPTGGDTEGGNLLFASQLHEEAEFMDQGYMDLSKQNEGQGRRASFEDGRVEPYYTDGLEDAGLDGNYMVPETSDPENAGVEDFLDGGRKVSVASLGAMYEDNSTGERSSFSMSMFDDSGLTMAAENPRSIGELHYESDDDDEEELQLQLGNEMNEDDFWRSEVEKQAQGLGRDRAGMASMQEMK